MLVRAARAHASRSRAVAKPLSHQRSKWSVEMIGQFTPGTSDIGFSLSSKQTKDGVVEDKEHLGRTTHA